MANDSKDVQFNIRAKDYSKKTLDEVVASLEALASAQQKQIDAARDGVGDAKALEKGYTGMAEATKALLKQLSDTKTLEAHNEKLAEAEKRLDAAREAQKRFLDASANSEKLTKSQITQQERLAKAVAGAEKNLRDAGDRVAASTAKLASYGIAAGNVAQAQERISSAVATAKASLDQQADAYANLEVNAKKAADAEAGRANRQKQLSVDRTFNDAQAKQITDAQNQQRAAQEAATAQTEKQLQVDRLWASAIQQVSDKLKGEQDVLEKQRQAMVKLADQAQATAKGYAAIARGTQAAGGSGLADSLRAITQPAQESIKTVAGLDAAIAGLEGRVTAVRGPVKGAADALRQMNEVQRSLVGIGTMVEQYQRQIAVLKQARAEYVAARAAVADLTAQIRAGSAGDDITRQMAAAQSALRQTATAFGTTATQARAMQADLRKAGVDTRDLAGAGQTLQAQAGRSAAAIDGLSAAVQKYGTASESAGKKSASLFGGERTSLSYVQRLRGEVLALATAYVGLNAAMGLAKDVISVYKENEAISSRLAVAVGNDSQKIAAEQDYLRASADRLGFEYGKLALAYSKFAIATKTSNITQQETRFIFEGIATAARVAKLSSEQFEGAMRAVEQMLNKGKVSSEELRQQLGEFLPGAYALFAKSIGKTTEELDKLLESGAVSSRALINFAGELQREYGSRLPEAMNSLASAEARAANAAREFKEALGNAGFIESYTELLRKLTEALKSEDGKRFAQSLGSAMSSIADALVYVIQNLETVKLVFTALIGLKVYSWLTGITTAAVALVSVLGGLFTTATAVATGTAAIGTAAAGAVGGVTAVTRVVGLLRLALLALGRAIPVLGAALVAYEIYQKVTAKKPGEGKPGAQGTWDYENGKEPKFMGTPDPQTGVNAATEAQARIAAELKKNQTKLDKETLAARLKGDKAELQGRLDIRKEFYDAQREDAKKNITDAGDLSKTMVAIDKAEKQALSNERMKFQNENAKSGAAAAAKAVKLSEEVAREIARIEDDLAKRETQEDPTASYEQKVKTRLDAIRHEYDKLYVKIAQLEKLEPKNAAGARDKLDAFVKQRQQIEEIKTAQEQLSTLEGRLNSQTTLRATLLQNIQDKYDKGAISQEQMLSEIQQVNDDAAIGISNAATALQNFAQAMATAKDGQAALLDPTKYKELAARIASIQIKSDPEAQNNIARLQAAQERLNALTADRKRIEESIVQQRELTLITDEAAVAQINELNGRFKDNVIAAANEVRTYATLVASQTGNSTARTGLLDQAAAAERTATALKNAQVAYTTLDSTIVGSIGSGVATAFEGVAAAIGKVAVGQQSIGQGFRDMAIASANFFASFLKDIGLAILRQQILRTLQGFGGGIGAAATAAIGAGVRHGGGMAGGGGRSRRVNPEVFMAAGRYHNGGLPGLAPNEIPTILEKQEEVLTRDDPRHILNGGGAGGPSAVRAVIVDDRARVPEAMASAEGDAVTLDFIKRNAASVKQLLGR